MFTIYILNVVIQTQEHILCTHFALIQPPIKRSCRIPQLYPGPNLKKILGLSLFDFFGQNFIFKHILCTLSDLSGLIEKEPGCFNIRHRYSLWISQLRFWTFLFMTFLLEQTRGLNRHKNPLEYNGIFSQPTNMFNIASSLEQKNTLSC